MSAIKKPYEKPVIRKLESGFMNKFGMTRNSSARNVRDNIEGVPVADLTEEFGSPLFVFSERNIRRRFRQVHNAFATRYPDVVCGWSYKTNYLKAICAIMHEEGAYAEIVSGMEYEKARGLGVPHNQIIFNGPHKDRETVRELLTNGGQIHIDHMDELEDMESLADELGQTLKVGLRLNLDAGIYPRWSRFGFNLESGEAMEAVRRMHRSGKLVLNGLHCHIGTFILDPQAYARQIEKMVEFMYAVRERFGFEMDYLDIGGGLPSKSKLKGTYHAPDVMIPDIDDYAEAICEALHRCLRPGDYPRLILEAGRAMIDEAGTLISTVLASKRLADGTRAYVVDGGINLLYTAFWYKYRIETDREIPGLRETSVLYGPMCMNIDIVDEGISLPPLERGQRLIVSPVGAYNVTQWLQFIEYRPNVVLIGLDGSVDLIREREDLTDIERRERLPERLSK